MDSRARRLAQNEAAFRSINERIAEAAEGFLADRPNARHEFLCECSDVDCVRRVALTLAEYEKLRRNDRRFVVAPEHELPEIEVVVERHERYWIVEKVGEAGEQVEGDTAA